MTTPPPPKQPIRDPAVLARMQMAFELYELAEQMMRQNLRRRNPGASEEEIEQGIRDWLLRSPSDLPTDGPFRPSTRFQE
jgi:hypothetical protein